MYSLSIKAVGFDIGHTLIKYNNPLNWKALYRPALQSVVKSCGITESDDKLGLATEVLSKYNTRENYREHEVSSDIIFEEILDAWKINKTYVNEAKEAFYSYFQADAFCFDDTVAILERLSADGLKIGFLTDVAYGMDNKYAFKDVASILHYFDVCLSSVDVGYRKPNEMGYIMLSRELDVEPSQLMFVGDEEKDIIGANKFGAVSVLINRTEKQVDFGQQYTIGNLLEIPNIIYTHTA